MRRRAMMQGDDYLKGWEMNKALNNKGETYDYEDSCVSPFLEVDSTINEHMNSAHYYGIVDPNVFFAFCYDANKKPISGSSCYYESWSNVMYFFIRSNIKYIRIGRRLSRINDCYVRYSNGPYVWAGKNVKQ